MPNKKLYPDEKHARMLELLDEVGDIAKSTFSIDEYEEFKPLLNRAKNFISKKQYWRENGLRHKAVFGVLKEARTDETQT